jgi:hypothetical protein
VEDLEESARRKLLKRELREEALRRYEEAARTVQDFKNVHATWDKLDANRERRERYHEVSRSGDDLPIDYGAKEDGVCFPDRMNSVLERQRQKGDFIDTIFNCPYDIHELVTEEYMSKALSLLSEDHKEILYFSAIRAYSTQLIGALRGQTDRNIRKVKNTLLKKIRKKILPELKRRKDLELPMTKDEREFLAEMEAQS